MGYFFIVVEILATVVGYRKNELSEYKKIVYADVAYYRQKKGIPMLNGIKVKDDWKYVIKVFYNYDYIIFSLEKYI